MPRKDKKEHSLKSSERVKKNRLDWLKDSGPCVTSADVICVNKHTKNICGNIEEISEKDWYPRLPHKQASACSIHALATSSIEPCEGPLGCHPQVANCQGKSMQFGCSD